MSGLKTQMWLGLMDKLKKSLEKKLRFRPQMEKRLVVYTHESNLVKAYSSFNTNADFFLTS